MRFSYLEQITGYLGRFERIVAAYRYSDSGIRIVFDADHALHFEMGRGDSSIMLAEQSTRGKIYQAPFDIMLAKRLNRSVIRSITMYGKDKILRIEVSQSGAYKSETTLLQLEFTGKHTNAILLDKEGIVLEALRHIDEEASSRTVRVGYPLSDPPPPPYEPAHFPLDDVEAYLRSQFRQRSEDRLQRLKQEKLALLEKQQKRLKKHLDELQEEDALFREAEREQHEGHLILANLGQIKPYQSRLETFDFEGHPVVIEFSPPSPSGAAYAEIRFKRAKKAKQKALGLHLERSNLAEKLQHLELFSRAVHDAASPEEIEILFPQKKERRKFTTSDAVAEFWVEGFKVSLGKNEKGNIQLLRGAKAKDLWFHLKDRPSAHVIVSTDKQQLPDKVIETAAKLCVDFSVFEKGNYLVDYTQRREVKMTEGANVLYNRFQTIMITKG